MDPDEVEVHGPPISIPTPLGKAYQVSTKYFEENLLPPLPPVLDLDAFLDNGAFSNVVTKQGTLWGFTNKTPAGTHRKDVNKAFLYLQRGIRSTVKAKAVVDKMGNAPLVFYNNRASESNIQQRTKDSLPDAFFLSHVVPGSSASWPSIAAFGEYAIDNTSKSAEENIKKLSESLTNCMRADPRRRFVYAFTAEDAAMRLWYCDRLHVFVSEPFNFIDGNRTLLHFALSLTFAEPHQLGWDPTIRRVDTDGGVQYDIMVNVSPTETALYRTLDLLSHEGGALRVLSRGTRVWKAVKIVDGEPTGDPVALKDVWVDSDREREGDVVSQVLQSTYLSENADMKIFFIPVHCHGDVIVSGKKDRTPEVVRYSRTDTIPGDTSDDERPSRVHYRIVYGEVGEPLSKVTSLYKVFRALKDAVIGVLLMHKSGWVHRDLSAGNIIIVGGRGKITDLEYATREGQQGRAGRTGTAPFLAVEVELQDYLFRPLPPASHGAIASPESEFRYNPLHDLESIWWNAVYFVVNRTVEGAQEQAYDRQAQLILADRLFNQCQGRYAILIDEDFGASRLYCLHPSLRIVSSALEELRKIIREAYHTAEVSAEPINFEVADTVYGALHPHFDRVAKHFKRRDIRLRRLYDTPDCTV